jgi:hypothetical protein
VKGQKSSDCSFMRQGVMSQQPRKPATLLEFKVQKPAVGLPNLQD